MVEMKFLGMDFSCALGSLGNGEFPEKDCLLPLISKLLGYCIVAASTTVKLPQILKILKHRSIRGLSVLSFELEVVGYTIALAYCLHKGLPFSAYGELAFLLIQAIILVAIIYYFSQPLGTKTWIRALLYCGVAPTILAGQIDPLLFEALYASQHAIFFFARIPQIWANFKNKSTGELSFLTSLMNFGGSMGNASLHQHPGKGTIERGFGLCDWHYDERYNPKSNYDIPKTTCKEGKESRLEYCAQYQKLFDLDYLTTWRSELSAVKFNYKWADRDSIVSWTICITNLNMLKVKFDDDVNCMYLALCVSVTQFSERLYWGCRLAAAIWTMLACSRHFSVGLVQVEFQLMISEDQLWHETLKASAVKFPLHFLNASCTIHSMLNIQFTLEFVHVSPFATKFYGQEFLFTEHILQARCCLNKDTINDPVLETMQDIH
ncbi:UNVERIFIED_CONTAM: Mannose-P-dolichol utilization defect 1 protein [Sesamum indicum]